jgi:hypothetical protein
LAEGLPVGLPGAGMYSKDTFSDSSSSSKYLRKRRNVYSSIYCTGFQYIDYSSRTHSSSVLVRFFGIPQAFVMALWLIAFNVEYPCLLKAEFGGGGRAFARAVDDVPFPTVKPETPNLGVLLIALFLHKRVEKNYSLSFHEPSACCVFNVFTR